jgi:hypothetical protein
VGSAATGWRVEVGGGAGGARGPAAAAAACACLAPARTAAPLQAPLLVPGGGSRAGPRHARRTLRTLMAVLQQLSASLGWSSICSTTAFLKHTCKGAGRGEAGRGAASAVSHAPALAVACLAWRCPRPGCCRARGGAAAPLHGRLCTPRQRCNAARLLLLPLQQLRRTSATRRWSQPASFSRQPWHMWYSLAAPWKSSCGAVGRAAGAGGSSSASSRPGPPGPPAAQASHGTAPRSQHAPSKNPQQPLSPGPLPSSHSTPPHHHPTPAPAPPPPPAAAHTTPTPTPTTPPHHPAHLLAHDVAQRQVDLRQLVHVRLRALPLVDPARQLKHLPRQPHVVCRRLVLVLLVLALGCARGAGRGMGMGLDGAGRRRSCGAVALRPERLAAQGRQGRQVPSLQLELELRRQARPGGPGRPPPSSSSASSSSSSPSSSSSSSSSSSAAAAALEVPAPSLPPACLSCFLAACCSSSPKTSRLSWARLNSARPYCGAAAGAGRGAQRDRIGWAPSRAPRGAAASGRARGRQMRAPPGTPTRT